MLEGNEDISVAFVIQTFPSSPAVHLLLHEQETAFPFLIYPGKRGIASSHWNRHAQISRLWCALRSQQGRGLQKW